MAERPDNDTVTVEGPLFGLPQPSIDPATLDAHVVAIGPHISSSQMPSSDSLLLAVRALWNARLPVHRLPTELLIDVLLRLPSGSCVGPGFVRSGASKLPMTMVCRRWRAVVKANPCFWCSIRVGEDLRWLDLALSRTGDAYLSLDFSVSSVFLTSIPQLVKRRNHIEALRFACRGAPSLRPVEPLLCVPLPSLATLDVTTDMLGNLFYAGIPEDRDTQGHCEVLLYEPVNFPGVTNLSLKGAQISIPWTTSFISNLRTLDIRGCMVHSPAMTVSAFLDVLRAGQRLEELTLHDLLPWACSSLPRPSERLGAVVLPRLRKASLADHVAWVPLYVGLLQLPPQGEVGFTGLIDGPTLAAQPTLTYTSMLPPDIRAFTFLICTTSASMVMDGHSCRITCNGPGPTITLELVVRSSQVWWHQTVDAAVTRFIDVLRNAPLVELELVFELDFELDIVGANTFDAVLDAFPRVWELRVRSRAVEGADAVPHFLCHSLGYRDLTYNAGSGEVGVRLPNLRVLRVQQEHENNDPIFPELVECLSNRMDGGAPKLVLLAVIVRRSGTENWWTFDRHYEAVFMPMVENFDFIDEGW